jgi:tetratricopeptide (TPR) repeat protein
MKRRPRQSECVKYVVLFFLLTLVACHAEPYLPRDGNEVLERLRATAFDPVQRELRAARARLAADPTNTALAAQFVRRCIERSRTDADPRYLGRAQAALAPWWNSSAPPVDILVLRATIKQSQHDFTNALTDLDAALRRDSRNAQAWLTRASVLTVLGDYAGARRACLPLAQLAPGLIALTAAANVTCLTGGAERGCGLLSRALEGNSTAAPGEKSWALTTLAEANQRLGRTAEAESDFKNALALGQRDPYLLGAYADLLLDEGRAAEAADLLKDETRADGLLLRLALAEAAAVPVSENCEAHVANLRARFEAGHLRGDFVHQREEARFQLHLLHQPAEALRLAQANWQVQHEPADVRILLESALAAGKPEAAQPAIDFIRSSHLEDAQLKKLVTNLSGVAAK